MSIRNYWFRTVRTLSARAHNNLDLLISWLLLLSFFAFIWLTLLFGPERQQVVNAAPLVCNPPLYQGYVNSCAGLRLLWLPGASYSLIDHFELKRYSTLIASNLAPNANGYSDLQGCDFAASYEIIQVMKDGSRCSTFTKGMLPHSYPCDKCTTPTPTPTPTPGPTPTPTPTPAPTPTPTPGPTPTPTPVGSVQILNAASYTTAIAPGAIAAIFGGQMTTVTMSAPTQPLPEQLGNTRVTVNGVAAQLLFVSPNQINLIMPENLTGTPAQILVYSADGSVKSGAIRVQTVAPGIFTMLSDGTGVPAGLMTQDGIYYQPVGNPDGTPRPLSPGTLANPAWLVLFGTGLRGNGSPPQVQVFINGISCPVAWAGPQADFEGLDQINAQLPEALRNNGLSVVEVMVNGILANRTSVTFNG